MSQDTGDPPARPDADDLLRAADPDLNVFALANGMDLYRDHEARPDRVLEWFRDGLERRIHVRPGPEGGLTLTVAASGKVDGVRRAGRRPFREAVAPEELRALLIEAIEAANAFQRETLDPA